MLEFTRKNGMKGMRNGMGDSGILIPGKKRMASVNALQSINQRAACAACKGGCDSHQANGVPVGMNFGKNSIEK